MVADAADPASDAAPSFAVPLLVPPAPSPHCPKALAPMQKTRPLSVCVCVCVCLFFSREIHDDDGFHPPTHHHHTPHMPTPLYNT